MSRRYLAPVLAVLLFASACSGSGDSEAETGAEATSPEETTDNNAAGDSNAPTGGMELVDEEPVTTGANNDPSENPYGTVGPADASVAPIRIGYMNWSVLAEVDTGFTAGIKWVNEELGGIDGHPVETVPCSVDLSPESSISCANSFVEAGVTAVAVGIDLVADSAVPILADAGIVTFMQGDLVASLRSANPDVYSLIAPSRDVILADAIFVAEEWGISKVAFIGGTDSGTKASYDLFVQASERLGVEVVGGLIAGEPGAAIDFEAQAAAVVASGAEGVVVPVADDFSCISLLNALNTFGFTGPRLMSSCQAYRTVVGPEIARGVYGNHPWVPADLKGVSGQVSEDIAALDRMLVAMGASPGGYVEVGFMLAPWVADVMSQATDPTDAASVAAAAATAKGERRVFAVSPWACDGSLNPGSSSCGSGVIMSRVDDDLNRVLVGDFPVDVSALGDL